MSFAQLATREAEINQSLLLGNLFNNEIEEEEQLPAVIEPTVQNTYTNRISIQENTQTQITTTNTNLILPDNNFEIVSVTNGTIATNYIRDNSTNRFYTVQTSATVVPTEARVIRRVFNTNGTSTTSLIPYEYQTNSTATSGTSIIYDGSGFYTNYTSWQIYTNNYLTEVDNCEITKAKKKNFGIQKLIKGSIKRALKLFDNFGMEEDARIFLNGKDIEVSHPESLFKFVLTKEKYHSVKSGIEYPIHSTPFKLSLFTKSNIHIADLCVYAENTPMLDQLLMIAMYVKSGNEEELLKKANYRNLCKDKETREILVLEHDYLGNKLLRN